MFSRYSANGIFKDNISWEEQKEREEKEQAN